MNESNMKKCPYCAELIRKEAVKCRYCGSNLSEKGINLDFLTTPGYWYRIDKGKKIAGVCTGLAHQFDSPILIMPLRLFFILTTIFYGFGIILYILLWLLMSPPSDSVDKPASVSTPGTVDATPSGGSDTKQPEADDTSDEESFEIEELNEPVSSETPTDTSPSENGKQDSAGKKSAAERRMMRYPLLGIAILFTSIMIILKASMIMLKSFVVFDLPPFAVISWTILAVVLLLTAGGLFYYKKQRVPLAEHH